MELMEAIHTRRSIRNYTDEPVSEELIEELLRAAILGRQPATVGFCADTRREVYPGFWPQDCSSATQNLLLAAHGLDLGAVWLGIHPLKDREDSLRELLDLPKQVIPFAIIALGHTDSKDSRINRFNPDVIFRNRWSNPFPTLGK